MKPITNLFADLLNERMTRRAFLVHLGLMIVVVSGITSLLHTLADPQLSKKQSRGPGFGRGPYGL